MTGKGIQKIIALSLNEDASYFRDRTCECSPDFISHLQLSTTTQSARAILGSGRAYRLWFARDAILKQDDLGGLQVKTKSGWIDAPPIASQVDSIGLDVSTHLPRRVTREELVGAVSLVCDVSDLAPPEVAIDRWDDCALPARI